MATFPHIEERLFQDEGASDLLNLDILPTEVVTCEPQTFTDAQKAQISDNVGSILRVGLRGSLAGYSTPAIVSTSPLTITKDSADHTYFTPTNGNIDVPNGDTTEWCKTVSITSPNQITLGSNWYYPDGEVPEIPSRGLLVLKWTGSMGFANIISTGEEA